MIDLETIKQIQQAPVVERIQLIEMILQSLKGELDDEHTDIPRPKHFVIRQFNMGEEIQVDRDDIYKDVRLLRHKGNRPDIV